MIKSMTGYGQADGLIWGIDHLVQIKTVNNRYLRIEVRLPEPLAFVQDDVEKLLRQHIVRGTVSCIIRPKDPAVAQSCMDEDALRQLIIRLDRVRSSLANCSGMSIDMATLLTLPQVTRPLEPQAQQAQQIRQEVLALVQSAIDKLTQMRLAEGQFLSQELLGYCQQIEACLERISQMRDQVLAGYVQRLRKRADELLIQAGCQLDEQTLAMELAVLAERSDIAEEIARLTSHIEQFRQACQDQDQTGRRLEFISQEMFREANTIASKAIDAKIASIIVDIKCQIDRIKEQVQNVE